MCRSQALSEPEVKMPRGTSGTPGGEFWCLWLLQSPRLQVGKQSGQRWAPLRHGAYINSLPSNSKPHKKKQTPLKNSREVPNL